MLYLTENVIHSQGRIHPKIFSGEHQLFPEAGFVHIIFKKTFYEKLLVSAEGGVREPWGSFPPSSAPGHHTSSASMRAVIRPGSPLRPHR